MYISTKYKTAYLVKQKKKLKCKYTLLKKTPQLEPGMLVKHSPNFVYNKMIKIKCVYIILMKKLFNLYSVANCIVRSSNMSQIQYYNIKGI